MTLYRIFSLSGFLTFTSLSRGKNFVRENVVPPAEGDLYMESVWPMGLRLGLVALYHLSAGVLVGMQIFVIFCTYPYCLYFVPWYLYL
jgi:hypothetical protein